MPRVSYSIPAGIAILFSTVCGAQPQFGNPLVADRDPDPATQSAVRTIFFATEWDAARAAVHCTAQPRRGRSDDGRWTTGTSCVASSRLTSTQDVIARVTRSCERDRGLRIATDQWVRNREAGRSVRLANRLPGERREELRGLAVVDRREPRDPASPAGVRTGNTWGFSVQ